MKEDKTFELLSQMIDKVFANYYKKENKMENQLQSQADGQTKSRLYESIEDFTTKTGKRFRMTKDQKQRGLTRDEAFNEANPVTINLEKN